MGLLKPMKLFAVILEKAGPLLRGTFLEEGGAEEFPMQHFHQQ